MSHEAATVFFSRVLARLHLYDLLRASLQTMVFIVGFLAFIGLLEWWQGSNPKRYLSRAFFNDVVYTLFYRGGFYTVFVAAAITNLLSARLGFMKIEILRQLPPPVDWILYWITVDFLSYWNHRLQHHSRFLWAFHSVHHAPEQMSFLTSFRLHPLDQLITNIIMIAPLLVLGVPTINWLPLVLIQNAFELVQHSELRWRYGPLYAVFVSPAFHAFHHSTDRAHYDRNFGKIFSLWDVLFGTAVFDQQPPPGYGVGGMTIPERLTAQVAIPFRMVRQLFARRTQD